MNPGTARARARRTHLFAYSGPASIITDLSGQITQEGDGFFVREMRVLSDARVLLDGKPLDVFSASTSGPKGIVAHGRLGRAVDRIEDALFVFITWTLLDSEAARLAIDVVNHAPTRARPYELTVLFDADFADVDEVKKRDRRQCAAITSEACGHQLTIRYEHPDMPVETRISLSEPAHDVSVQDCRFAVLGELAPQQRATVEFEIARHPRAYARERVRYRSTSPPPPAAPRLRTCNATVDNAWRTAVADLQSLPLRVEGAPYAVNAGVPIYQHFFGRDTLTAGWQALLAAPEYLRDALIANAELQARQVDDWFDEQPGKMIHEARAGPLSLLGVDPLLHNYGDYATAPDFVAMLAQYYAWTGDVETTRRLLPAAWRALEWLDQFGDLDQDGFLEYDTRSERGVKNQGWKDAPDSIVDDEGRSAPNPLATSELQGYWYAALQMGAVLAASVARDVEFAWELRNRANRLREQFHEAFWLEDEGHYALSLDAEKRPIRAAGSNDAHLLATGIVPSERARAVVRRLFEPDIFSGWGMRTLTSEHPAYNPFSYHRGSVWPVEQGTFAFGLARYGFWDELHRLAKAVFECADLFESNRLPEVVGGLQRDGGRSHPGVYPEACAPQAWSASAVVQILQAMLGLNPWVPARAVFLDPHLPPWLGELWLRGIRVGGGELDLHAWRDRSGRTKFKSRTRGGGRLMVLRQAPPQDLTATRWSRVKSLVRR